MRHHGGVRNRIVEGDDFSVLPAPIVRGAQALRRLFGRSGARDERDGGSEVVSQAEDPFGDGEPDDDRRS